MRGVPVGVDADGLVDWLLEVGGPVVRYRTAVELLDSRADLDMEGLRTDLLCSPQVARWLERLERPVGVGDLHSSRPTAFENAMGKLHELGLRAGIPELDERTEPFREWLGRKLDERAEGLSDFYVRLVAGTLARAGYSDAPVQQSLDNTLTRLHRTARKGSCDIWLSPQECAGLPKSCLDKPIIRPEFAFDGRTPLPIVHDLHGLSGLLARELDAPTRRKISVVIGYLLRPDYQRLPDGYGYLFDTSQRQLWAHGWGVSLPGHQGFNLIRSEASRFVQRLELMAHFPRAVRSAWFGGCLRHLAQFRLEDGSYRLPRGYLEERASGYYVQGAYMGLEENRRARQAMAAESTFRVLRIRRLAGA
jgi:hypothetical protein